MFVTITGKPLLPSAKGINRGGRYWPIEGTRLEVVASNPSNGQIDRAYFDKIRNDKVLAVTFDESPAPIVLAEAESVAKLQAEVARLNGLLVERDKAIGNLQARVKELAQYAPAVAKK